MFNWLRRFFRRILSSPLTKEEKEDIEVSVKEIEQGKARTFNNTDEFLKELHDSRYATIAQSNLERQKNTLGYGLKSRNFKPRSAYEKRLWKLDKKPDKELD